MAVGEWFAMTEKDMKKLNRYQLLEMLIMQTTRADELQKQVEALQQKLDDREISMTAVGSIAEATVQISGIMATAQNTADLYLEAVQKRVKEIEIEAVEKAEQIVADAKKEAKRIVSRAKKTVF